MGLGIDELRSSDNIAELLDKNELDFIGKQVVEGYDIDEDSRRDWAETIEKAMDIAKQTLETKNHPFTNSSNVKYPLITKAAIDFASRIYPEIIQNDKVVKATVIGNDPEGLKLRRATRVSKFISYQLLEESDNWEDGLDKLLHVLPILGTVFKKTYFHPFTRRPMSDLCLPDKIVVNYEVPSLEEARRITHILTFYANDIIERMRAGLYRDVDVELLKAADGYENEDTDAPLALLEQHCYLDLDDDGYKEPYVVTIHQETREVLRIVSRFKKVKKDKEGRVKRIEPEQFFTDFHFIRSPDGGFYSSGLGTLLYPLNSAINTLINQLIDSGTINNSQSGFLGRGLRIKAGEMRLKLNEWRVLDAAPGVNVRENIFPLPTKEPSATLFQLLGLLIEIGKDLVSATDLLQGKGQTQNVPAATVLTMVEQGMKVFNAINKRLYRSLKKEFIKVYKLDREFVKAAHYLRVLDDPDANMAIDFNGQDFDILPVADPNMASDRQRIAKAEAVLQAEGLDPHEKTRFYLEALQVDEKTIDKLLPKPDPNAPPPPEAQKMMAETEKFAAQAKHAEVQARVLSQSQLAEAEKLQIQVAEAESRIRESEARIRKMIEDSANNANKVELAALKAGQEGQLKEEQQDHTVSKENAELDIRLKELEESVRKDTKDTDK